MRSTLTPGRRKTARSRWRADFTRVGPDGAEERVIFVVRGDRAWNERVPGVDPTEAPTRDAFSTPPVENALEPGRIGWVAVVGLRHERQPEKLRAGPTNAPR